MRRSSSISISLLVYDLSIKADGAGADALFHDLLQTVKGAAADKEDIGGVDLDQLLMRMLSASLRRNAGNGSLQEF